MSSYRQAVDDFLAPGRRIAVAGVSRQGDQPANLIYRKLRDAGYEVWAINPAADRIEDATCHPDLAAVPAKLDGVVAATPPAATEDLARQCRELGIPRLWMHRSFGTGSVSPAAVESASQDGLTVLAGGCPMMFVKPIDPAHRCMRWILDLTGGLPAPGPK
jgi:hypothetical protein